MDVARLSLYTLDWVEGSFLAGGGAGMPFEPARYSLLKYGSATAAEGWGRQLADWLPGQLPDLIDDLEGPVVTASAFHQVPTAAFAVALSLRGRLDRHRLVRGHGALDHGRIVRDVVYAGEYETLDAERRREVLAAMRLSYQGPELEGRHLVVVDDVRVSGTHEQVLTELLAPLGPARLSFVYLVQVNEHTGTHDSSIEQRLNNSAIDSLEALRELLRTEPTLLNARVVKRILLWPRTPQQLDALLGELPDGLLSRLYKAALADGYHRLPPFQGAFARLEALLQTRLQEEEPRIRQMGDDPAAQPFVIDLARHRIAAGI